VGDIEAEQQAGMAQHQAGLDAQLAKAESGQITKSKNPGATKKKDDRPSKIDYPNPQFEDQESSTFIKLKQLL